MESVEKHSYGLSATQMVPGYIVYVFLEVCAAVIFRRSDSGKLVAVGGATVSTSLKDSLALMAERLDNAPLAVLRDGLFSGVKVTERDERQIDAQITVQDLEGVLTTDSAMQKGMSSY